MFAVKGRLKVALLTVLAVLLIGAGWVYARSTTDGYNDEVYWDVMVESLYRFGNYTYSTHQYYIENDSKKPVTLLEQEFKHRVIQTFPDTGKPDKEEITKRNDDMTDTVRIEKGRRARRVFRHKVSISHLRPGRYYIRAYTRINLKGISENPEPKAAYQSPKFNK